ncbi:MAG: hypothetical protein IJJ56_13875, partial [Prevotella sp.]|nr:hypothetical protein [Prevotella sp.]
MKRLFTLVAMALALTGAKADVVINATNFPDENFRAEVADYFDSDGDGIISDEEMETNGGQHNYWNVSNLKGIELLTSIYRLVIINYPDEPGLTTFDYTLPNLLQLEFQDQVGILTTVDATKCTNLEDFLAGDNPVSLSTLKLPGSLKSFALYNAPLIKTFDPMEFPKLNTFILTGNTGITDVDFTNHTTIQNITVEGGEDKYQFNSLVMPNCPKLMNIDIKNCTIKSLTFKSLPEMLNILVYESDITSMLVEDLPQLGSIEGHDNDLGTLTLKKLPAIGGLDCSDNRLQTLLIDDCPNFTSIYAENNRLMWLDLSGVKNNGVEANYLSIDNQQPSTVAYKLSPSEVGLLVHERFDVERVLNLKAGGKSVTPAWSTIDGKTYFVFSNDGANADALVGQNTTYEYETKWPYAWVEGHSKDNNLPVLLNVTKVEKLPSWIKLSSTETLKGKVDGTLTPPEVSRSDKYDGKLTWTSSDESVVMVDAETGALSIIGAGTATISVSGAETDYRTAPVTVTYTVSIETGETCDITIGKNGKTTFCGDMGLDFSYSDEVKAFIATGFDKTEGTIWMTRVKDVPAGVPVMIKGTAEETYHVPVT